MSKPDRSEQRPIYLIGMMGVGKSTVGAMLAARLGRAFVDTDDEVERVSGRTIAEIFATEGEAGFRALEAKAIDAAAAGRAVISLGGGAVVAPGALEKLLETGETVYLEARPELLVERIGDATSRPLLAGLDRAGRIRKLRALLEERLVFYERAKIRVDARGRAEEVVERILHALGEA